MLTTKSKIVSEVTSLPTDVARLIGQFANFELSLNTGDFFYELHQLGDTYMIGTRPDSHPFMTSRCGPNTHVTKYEVVKKTLKSYLLKYKSTITYSHNFYNDVVLRYEYQNGDQLDYDVWGPRRVYPLKRVYEFDHDHLESLLRKKVIDCNPTSIVGRHNTYVAVDLLV